MEKSVPLYSRGDLPSFQDAGTYRKRVTTRAVKIDGEFVVDTSEGQLHCHDGYLAIDARGYPYPIATEEFELIYELEDTPPYVEPTLGEVLEKKLRSKVQESWSGDGEYIEALATAYSKVIVAEAYATAHNVQLLQPNDLMEANRA